MTTKSKKIDQTFQKQKQCDNSNISISNPKDIIRKELFYSSCVMRFFLAQEMLPRSCLIGANDQYPKEIECSATQRNVINSMHKNSVTKNV